ncbi:MAG: fasciclin domain-containing protein [Pseudomonadota bacterium]
MKSIKSLALAGALALSTATTASAADIVDTVLAKPEFSTLAKMVKQAGLVETLKSEGPFTVFAPTNEAFKAWPQKEVDLFLKAGKEKHLVRLLKTHVVPGAVTSSDLAGKTVDAKTAEGTTIKVDGTDGVKIGNSKVTQADIKVDNGVIHVIDAPLKPEAYRGSF